MKIVRPPIAICLAIFLTIPALPSHATWKREYASTPQSVQEWFRSAKLTDAARKRFGFQSCCDQSDRFDTRFGVNKTTAGDEWFYRADDRWFRIPDDIIHDDEIHAKDPKDDALPEFEEMRREGVLFIYNGKPTCFWKPKGLI